MLWRERAQHLLETRTLHITYVQKLQKGSQGHLSEKPDRGTGVQKMDMSKDHIMPEKEAKFAT